MQSRRNIHNLESLEREIYRLKVESRRMEKDLNNNFDHLQENYKSYVMNSFFNRKHGKAKEKHGFLSSLFGNEAFQSALGKIANQLADRISNGIDSIIDKLFGKKN